LSTPCDRASCCASSATGRSLLLPGTLRRRCAGPRAPAAPAAARPIREWGRAMRWAPGAEVHKAGIRQVNEVAVGALCSVCGASRGCPPEHDRQPQKLTVHHALMQQTPGLPSRSRLRSGPIARAIAPHSDAAVHPFHSSPASRSRHCGGRILGRGAAAGKGAVGLPLTPPAHGSIKPAACTWLGLYTFSRCSDAPMWGFSSLKCTSLRIGAAHIGERSEIGRPVHFKLVNK
jgi:hypothetical protein